MTVAALFVDQRGPYFDLAEQIDPWDERRDARLYSGPHPVIAHPPCNRWGKLAAMVESIYGYKRGEDGGCFAAALAAVRRWGGVLEHPAGSAAWPAFGLPQPYSEGWRSGADGFSAQVCQGHYGHAVRKLTWLFVAGVPQRKLPQLRWGESARPAAAHRAGGRYLQSGRRRVSERELIETPVEFRNLLLAIANAATES